jgi:hypothetical protein
MTENTTEAERYVSSAWWSEQRAQFQKAAFTRDLAPVAPHMFAWGKCAKTAAPDCGKPSDPDS